MVKTHPTGNAPLECKDRRRWLAEGLPRALWHRDPYSTANRPASGRHVAAIGSWFFWCLFNMLFHYLPPSLDHGGMKRTQTGFGTYFSATGASGTNNFATTAWVCSWLHRPKMTQTCLAGLYKKYSHDDHGDSGWCLIWPGDGIVKMLVGHITDF